MNKDAGRSQLVFVTIQLEDGQDLPCGVDTGCFNTILDRSLEPKLGKRYDTGSISAMGAIHEVGIYLTGNSATVEGRKKGDPSTYHYAVSRASEKGSWKLQRAWRTDQDGKPIEEYPVP